MDVHYLLIVCLDNKIKGKGRGGEGRGKNGRGEVEFHFRSKSLQFWRGLCLLKRRGENIIDSFSSFSLIQIEKLV